MMKHIISDTVPGAEQTERLRGAAPSSFYCSGKEARQIFWKVLCGMVDVLCMF